MPRDADQAVQVPGAPQPDAAADQPQADGQAQLSELDLLRLQLAAKDAEIADLSAKAAAAPTIVDSVVYEPKTRHGAVALAESAFAAMTTSEVHAKVKAGEITLAGKPSVLCADGYYCDPSYR